MKLAYPISPVSINQVFGATPEYYARFKDTSGKPYKGHMGLDLMAYHGQPLYAPCDGLARWVVDDHGGEGIHLEAEGYRIIMWHLCSKNDTNYKPLIPTDGQHQVTKGQHLAYTDNSGAPFESSGDHLHLGVIGIDKRGNALNPDNGYGGNLNPLPFFSGESAVPQPKLPSFTSVPYEQAVQNLKNGGLKGLVYNLALFSLKVKYGKL